MPSDVSMTPNPHSARDAAPKLALPWVVRLRYGMVLCGVAALLAAAPVFHISARIILWALVPYLLMLVTNLWLRRAHHLSPRAAQQTLGGIFVFDILCLTAVLGLTGGPMNPFSLLFLVQITLSVVVLKKEWTWTLGLLSALCFGSLFFLNVPLMDMHIMPAEYPHLVGMWAAFVAAAALISFFTGRVSDALRDRELEVLALQEKVARQERLASLGTLAAGAAHELGTPLGTIAIVARELERYATTLAEREGLNHEACDDLSEDARLIRSEVERCQRILQGMSARGAEPMGEAPQAISVSELLRQMLEQVPEAKRMRIRLHAQEDQTRLTLPVRATVQSLSALVSNAFDAGGESVEVQAACMHDNVVLTVRDHGSGMSEEVLRHVTEPFFTTKPPGLGMGLGTFLARTFAEHLGGALSYDSAPGQGTTATLALPIRCLQPLTATRPGPAQELRRDA
ncbi:MULTISPECIES: ATP-binding protein [Acidobacterium]|nr:MULTISPECIES: ATP-binding protein [Acidobacterium]